MRIFSFSTPGWDKEEEDNTEVWSVGIDYWRIRGTGGRRSWAGPVVKDVEMTPVVTRAVIKAFKMPWSKSNAGAPNEPSCCHISGDERGLSTQFPTWLIT